MNNPKRVSIVKCRPDCRFFSTYTNTCDYTLMMYRTRGCPREACTKYEKRMTPRSWNKSSFDPEAFYYGTKEDKTMYIPEPSLDPPESDKYITAGCGHEVFEGEEIFEWENGVTLCGDCLEERFLEMCLTERAELLGCEHRIVSFSKKGRLYDR